MIRARRLAILPALAALLSLASAPAFAAQRPPADTCADERDKPAPTHCVVLLHGVGSVGLVLKSMEWGLEREGYVVANVSYPSLAKPIEELAEAAVGEGLDRCRSEDLSRIHFVTHSMGGILVRQYLAMREIRELGRVVMLAPPNQGSQLADYVDASFLKKVYAPEALAQLGTGEGSVPLRLPPPDFELGVIAGALNRRKLLPGTPEEPSDGVVTVEETRMPSMKDFIEVPSTHTSMVWDDEVRRQTIHFLRNGHFDHRVEGN